MPPVDDAIETETDQPQTADEAAAEEAAFVQSFGGQPETPTEPAPPAGQATDEEDETAPETAESSDPTEPAPPRTLTAEEYEAWLAKVAEVDNLKAALTKLESTTAGRIGGLQRELRERQAQTPVGQTVKVTAEDFTEMQRDFPELVNLTVNGLNRALEKVKGTGEFDPQAFEQKVTERVTAETQQIKLDLMDSVREDWREVVNSEPYKQWLATQPVEYQTQVLDSWSPRVVLGSIKSFETATKPPVTPSDPTPPTPPTRSRRLAAAVAPKSAGGAGSPTAKTEDDYFNEGFTTGRVTR